MSLHGLLNETIYNIAVLLDLEDLLGFTLCSPQVNAASTIALYRTVSLQSDDALPLFLRTLLSKPSIGAHVHTLFTEQMDHNPTEFMARYTTQDFSKMQSTINDICAVQSNEQLRRAWMSRICQGDWNATVALALFRLTSLRELYLTGYEVATDLDNVIEQGGLYTVHTAFQYMANTAPYLQFLNHIEIEVGSRNLTYDQILSFCKPIAVKEVIFGAVSGSDLPTSQISLPHITQLSLKWNSCSSSSMMVFLAMFPQVIDFYFKNGAVLSGGSTFQPKMLGNSIQHLKQCMRYLQFFNEDYDDAAIEGDPKFRDEMSAEDEELQMIGSLHDFQCLKVLVVDADALLGLGHRRPLEGEPLGALTSRKNLYEIIPTCLEILYLTKSSTPILSQLWELVHWKTRTSSSLNSIDITWRGSPENGQRPYWGYAHPPHIQCLITAGSAAGIEIGVEVLILEANETEEESSDDQEADAEAWWEEHDRNCTCYNQQDEEEDDEGDDDEREDVEEDDEENDGENDGDDLNE